MPEIDRDRLVAKLDAIPEADREPYLSGLKARGYTWKSKVDQSSPIKLAGQLLSAAQDLTMGNPKPVVESAMKLGSAVVGSAKESYRPPHPEPEDVIDNISKAVKTKQKAKDTIEELIKQSIVKTPEFKTSAKWDEVLKLPPEHRVNAAAVYGLVPALNKDLQTPSSSFESPSLSPSSMGFQESEDA
jgi:hypothetical protein